MADNWGDGVTRVLSALRRNFSSVVWRDKMPPLDSELNLVAQIASEQSAQALRAAAPSGFLADPTRITDDYTFDARYANQFYFGVPSNDVVSPGILALVNGWVIPVVGTDAPESSGDVIGNRIRLNPPPTTGLRVDLVFLEAWTALIEPTPATANKPTADTIYPFGNVSYGGATLVSDDLIDPVLQTATTARVQVQYRIRVVGSGNSVSVDLVHYPDGLTDPQVKARGTRSTDSGFGFTNARAALGDPSLWRAGDGDPDNGLGTTDGYVYAVPIAAVRRRNVGTYSTILGASPNTNGAPERTPSSRYLSDPRAGARTLVAGTLTSAITPTATGYVGITGYAGSALNDPYLFPSGTTRRYLVIGEGADREIVSISPNLDPSGHPTSIFIEVGGRGRAGTGGRAHAAGARVALYTDNPAGLYADEIVETDVTDLRRSVTLGEWDYNRILQSFLGAMVRGDLRTSAKFSGSGGNTFGTQVVDVTYLQATDALPSPVPSGVSLGDGPDGIRTVWSDAVTVQRDVTVIADHLAPLSAGFTAATFDATAGATWTVGADFQPRGWLNTLGSNTGWSNGSTIFLYLGGATGDDGARAGIRGNSRNVRFVAPYEMALPGASVGGGAGQQTPFRLRFTGGESGNIPGTVGSISPSNNAFRAGVVTNGTIGGMYPTQDTNFHKPFIVLGGVLNSALVRTGVPATSSTFRTVSGTLQIVVPGLNFDTFALPLGPRGESLRDYLTANGTDFTGASSRLYILSYGDNASKDNNGAFRVIGAGTSAAGGGPYTQWAGGTTGSLVVDALSADFSAFADSTGRTVTLEFRSQEITANDDHGTGSPAGVAVVMTDLAHASPWGDLPSTISIQMDGGSPSRLVPIASKLILSMDVMWGPGRGATTRVPDMIQRFGSINSSASMVRSPLSAVDASFVSDTGYPSSDRLFPPTPLNLWNRLTSLGEGEARAPEHGGSIVGLTEVDRDCELFVDPGSKTALFRPHILRNMLIKGFDTGGNLLGSSTYTGGVLLKDGAAVYTTGLQNGYAIPTEYMPRFGRQDIPYHRRAGTGDPILTGINHLFGDSTDATATVFYIVGGEDNPGPSGTLLVSPMLYASTIAYGARGTVGGSGHPAYGARKCYYTDVVSSDMGAGLRGVELPPYQGIARLYGVYERADFLAHLDPTYPGGFQADRITPTNSPPKNLLRVNADKQTLYIRQNGGNDVTGFQHSHTYVVPETALDLTLIPGFVPGVNRFDEYDYVVECVGFGFAEGFIDQNNYVLGRRHTGSGASAVDGDNRELSNVSMILPSAAPRGDALYVDYLRTVYQGDPFYTRSGSTPLAADYPSRYGSVSISDSFDISTPIQQFDASGNMTVERPNARSFEILASADIYTTLGTGKMSGRVCPGTITDPGYMTAGNANRMPSADDAASWATLPRAYTQDQGSAASYAKLSFEFLNLTLAVTSPRVAISINGPGLLLRLVAGVDFTGGSLDALATAYAAAVNASSIAPRVFAAAYGSRVELVSKIPGTRGNSLYVQAQQAIFPVTLPAGSLSNIIRWTGYAPATVRGTFQPSRVNFSGGVDVPVNAGDGNSLASLAGLTERLPLGILVSDSDFICESPTGDGTTFLRGSSGAIRALYSELPLSDSGAPYTPFLGEPGAFLALSDGSVLQYVPYTATTPSGVRAYRIYRGGGAVFTLSDPQPGGPLSWVSETFPAALKPVLKGAILSAKVLLVRNFREVAFGLAVPGRVRSEGGEIQVVIVTSATYGNDYLSSEGLFVAGVISPTGYGEGYSAADRYLVPGRPMFAGKNRDAPDPTIDPAPYVLV